MVKKLIANALTIPDFCRLLSGVNTQGVQSALVGKGVLIRTRSGYKPAPPFRKHFKINHYEYDLGKHRVRPLVTENGASLLCHFYRNNELPMRKDWDGSHVIMEPNQPNLSH